LILPESALHAPTLLPRVYAPPDRKGSAEESGDSLFTAEELDDLLASIALYPDPLLAQIPRSMLDMSRFHDKI
jgi:hypothetical protein